MQVPLPLTLSLQVPRPLHGGTPGHAVNSRKKGCYYVILQTTDSPSTVPISKQYSSRLTNRVGGGGGSSVPLPVPHSPGPCLFFDQSHFFMLFLLQNIIHYCNFFLLSFTSCHLGKPTLVRLPAPLLLGFSTTLPPKSCPPPPPLTHPNYKTVTHAWQTHLYYKGYNIFGF